MMLVFIIGYSFLESVFILMGFNILAQLSREGKGEKN